MAFSLNNLNSLISVALQNNASDIHIRSGEPPCLRIRGELVPVKSNKNIEFEDVKDICNIIFPQHELEHFDHIKDLDFVYEIPELCRIRYNFFRYSNKIGLILRLVPMNVPEIDDLNLSPILKSIVTKKRGLILVTGATGSGKSTTLAALINQINETETRHIVTIEDPIEFLHPQKKSRITQREIGTDTEDFTSALRAAMRQDPDVILIGELRDAESISTALKASETGHLVFATVHTTDAIATIGRILSMFPPEELIDVRKRLADSLFATISQRMVKSTKVKRGVVIAQEIMVTNPGVKECIRGEEPMDRIIQIIEKGGTNELGVKCQSFDQNIMELYKKGLITKAEAEKSVRSKSDFVQKLMIE
ncbi:type IV pilus twitching motility protein PilT [Bacteriovorax sp. Seq25_V]|uniref:type IV pilus twitching motility protein PilT n=1 Tax=Bacteriovorax sp. Seq25_V TaxID=1201288 RepID=UPI00038A2F5A|nr:PilT/PilU family type 4a pilus ATPase [Bacteriovorax sp. Seq25_V]EQC45261.1 twitching motility protein [Bacteriovorax sp. Seq25_V]